jgi:hypothetical protein
LAPGRATHPPKILAIWSLSTGEVISDIASENGKSMVLKPKHREAFLANVDASGECWVWTGDLLPEGYGDMRVMIGGRMYRGAHRIAFVLARGDIPKGKHVCHHCDNRACVRPSHLYIGDIGSNAFDMARRGRAHPGTTRFPAEIVAEARTAVDNGEPTRAVAERTGISRRHVRDIVAGFSRPPNRYGDAGADSCRHGKTLAERCRRCAVVALEHRFYGLSDAPNLTGEGCEVED